MGFLAKLLSLSILPTLAAQAEKLIHAELAAGSPLNKAIDVVLANLESHIPDPLARATVDEMLRALLAVVEGTIASSLPSA